MISLLVSAQLKQQPLCDSCWRYHSFKKNFSFLSYELSRGIPQWWKLCRLQRAHINIFTAAQFLVLFFSLSFSAHKKMAKKKFLSYSLLTRLIFYEIPCLLFLVLYGTISKWKKMNRLTLFYRSSSKTMNIPQRKPEALPEQAKTKQKKENFEMFQILITYVLVYFISFLLYFPSN